MTNGTKIPHALRLIIFFLRLTLGLHFAYLGFNIIFQMTPGTQLGGRSLSNLFTWLNVPASTGSFPLFFQWAFLAIGVCLILGFLTRTMSVAGIVLILVSYVPNITLATLNVAQLLQDEALFVVCLLVIIFANAGTYLGVDNFIHIHLSSQHKR